MENIWQPCPVDLQLSRDTVEVVRIHLDSVAEPLDARLAALSVEERARVADIRSQKRYREFVIGRSELRRLLAASTGQPAASFEIDYFPRGKPHIRKHWRGAELSFNVSHSHGWAVIALGLDRNIGIDIEQNRDNVQFEKLATRWFSENESRDLMTFPDAERSRAFFACWTRKEAFLKATGEGIGFGLSEFDVNLNPDAGPVLLTTRWDPAERGRWWLRGFTVHRDFLGTLAADGMEVPVRYWHRGDGQHPE